VQYDAQGLEQTAWCGADAPPESASSFGPTQEIFLKSRFLSALALTSLLGGCAITQNVKPVDNLAGKEICVVVNPAVSQPGFLVAYTRSLNEKGYMVRELPPGSSVNECPVTSTYTANWRWDLALYMAFADIKVYQNGSQVGQAVYDAMSGGANMSKFIKGDAKIAELVDQLFPGRVRKEQS